MIRPTTRSRIAALTITAVAFVAVGCVAVSPAASPTISIATPTPTTSATATATTPATATPTVPPTSPPTAPPTDTSTEPPPTSAPPTEPPPTSAPPTSALPTDGLTPPPSDDELDFSLEPRYGLHELTAGFTPDPFTVAVTSGGLVNASYISGCNGFAAIAPDVKIRYTAGSATLLRFYFTPDDLEVDTTLIINDPNGEWLCDDDAYAPHPAVDADPTLGGRYDIWIGSYDQGGFHAGTLSVTELDFNHPPE